MAPTAKVAPKTPAIELIVMMKMSRPRMRGFFLTSDQKITKWKRQGNTKLVAVFVHEDTKFKNALKSGMNSAIRTVRTTRQVRKETLRSLRFTGGNL